MANPFSVSECGNLLNDASSIGRSGFAGSLRARLVHTGNHQHRARRLANDSFCDASEHEMSDTGAAVGRHNHEVDHVLFDEVLNFGVNGMHGAHDPCFDIEIFEILEAIALDSLLSLLFRLIEQTFGVDKGEAELELNARWNQILEHREQRYLDRFFPQQFGLFPREREGGFRSI